MPALDTDYVLVQSLVIRITELQTADRLRINCSLFQAAVVGTEDRTAGPCRGAAR